MLISKPIFTQIGTTMPAEPKRIYLIFQTVIGVEGLLCLLAANDLRGSPGNKTQMRVEKGEDVKQSADQSSPDSKKVGN